MRHLQFTINDGRTMDLEVSPRLEQHIRDQRGMDQGENVSDAVIKEFFLKALVKAGE